MNLQSYNCLHIHEGLAKKMVKINKNMSFKYFYFKSDSIYLYESFVITFKPQKSRNTWIILLQCSRYQSIKANLEK